MFRVTSAGEARSGQERCGLLLGSIPTPTCAAFTRCGALPELTVEQVREVLTAVATADNTRRVKATAQDTHPRMLMHVCALDM